MRIESTIYLNYEDIVFLSGIEPNERDSHDAILIMELCRKIMHIQNDCGVSIRSPLILEKVCGNLTQELKKLLVERKD